MQALSGARCTDARLYTLWIKIGTRTKSARERSQCSTRLEPHSIAGGRSFNYVPASGDFYRLLITFANSLDPDQD